MSAVNNANTQGPWKKATWKPKTKSGPWINGNGGSTTSSTQTNGNSTAKSQVTISPQGHAGNPGFRGEDKHSQYGPDFQVVDHGPKLKDSSGAEVLVGLHDNPPVSVNYKPVQLNEKDQQVAGYIDGQLREAEALGIDWNKEEPQVKDLAGRMVSPGEALLQAARANDVDPLEMAALLLETQKGNNRYNEHVSPLRNPLFQNSIAMGEQSRGKAGLDYAFGIPRPEWEGFTNQAYLAAGNFRTKAAYGSGDWWKGSRSGGAESHFRGAQAARYIQEHGDGFADGAIAKYNSLKAGFESQHGPYKTQYEAYGPDDRPHYASGGKPTRQVSSSGSAHASSRQRYTRVANPLTGSFSPFGRQGQQMEAMLQLFLTMFLTMPQGPERQQTGQSIVKLIKGKEAKLSDLTKELLMAAAPSLENYKPERGALLNHMAG